jgi:hypothetical protein
MVDHEYGLVMPFVVVTSVGGPYDDDAYVAGYEAGMADAQLAHGPRVVDLVVRSDNAPQIDLIGMRHGYTVHTTIVDSGWSCLELIKADPDV